MFKIHSRIENRVFANHNEYIATVHPFTDQQHFQIIHSYEIIKLMPCDGMIEKTHHTSLILHFCRFSKRNNYKSSKLMENVQFVIKYVHQIKINYPF